MIYYVKLKQLHPIDVIGTLVAIISIVGIVWTPKINTLHSKVRGKLIPILLTVDVRDLPIEDKVVFFSQTLDDQHLQVSVRNQPTGRLKVKNVYEIIEFNNNIKTSTQNILSHKYYPVGLLNARFKLEASGSETKNGIIVAGTKVKIGVPIVLEGKSFRINGTVTNIQRKK